MSGHGMSHQDAYEALAALSLDALEASERDAVSTHVAGCPECRAELARLKSTAAELAFAVTPARMAAPSRDRIRGRLMARAGADKLRASGDQPVAAPRTTPVLFSAPRETHHEPPPQQHYQHIHGEVHHDPSLHIMIPHSSHAPPPAPKHWMNSPASWVALAASLVAIVTGYMLYQTTSEKDAISAAYRVAVSERSSSLSADSLRAVLDARERQIASMTGPQVEVISLTAASATAPSARMFWDQSVNAWTFVAHNLPRPKPGRTYQLWLVTASTKINAGIFTPQPNGDATVRATYALPKDGLSAVAVTEEPLEGSAQPTTTPFIVGVKSTR